MQDKQLISELNLIKARIKNIETKSTIQEKRIGKAQQKIDKLGNRLGFLENNTNNL